jgi:hypothetical protein
MDRLLKIIGAAFLIALTINGLVMVLFPRHLHRVPSWLRMYGVFNTSYGSRGGANQYPIAQWQVRLKGAIYLIPIIFILFNIWRK